MSHCVLSDKVFVLIVVKFCNNSYKYFANIKMRAYICNPLQKVKGSLAQLVQSICLTSRGSLVRAQQFPHYNSSSYMDKTR
jgi:hypothetical protein